MTFGRMGATGGFGGLGALGKRMSSGITVPNGLVGYWTLDTLAAADSSSNANNGTATGSPTVVAGQVGNAFNLTGANYVTAPSIAAYNFTTGGYSYAFWVKGTLASQVSFVGLIAKGNASNDFGLSRDTATTALSVFHGATGIDFPLGTATNLLDGSLNHCAVTYDGTTALLYINNVFAGSITIGPPTFTAGFPFYIGSGRNGLVPFIGIIDNVKLWNRNLSSAEVTLDYNAGLAGHQ